jgi:3-oxoacyl-[acyl-carrier protein] reductase
VTERGLPGKVAVVTGAGRGIGRSVARALSQEGARVALLARSQEQIDAVAEELRSRGGEAIAQRADVSNEDDVAQAFAHVAELWGDVDLLVNNAGIGAFGEVATAAPEDLDRILATNVRGTLLCTQAALRSMMPRRQGTVINIASVVGFRGYPRQGLYTASKHAVMGLTKSLAIEAQEHNIRVSAILPGGVNTDMIGDARPDLDRSSLLQPEDIAKTVLFLVSLPEHAAVDEIYIRRRGSTPF